MREVNLNKLNMQGWTDLLGGMGSDEKLYVDDKQNRYVVATEREARGLRLQQVEFHQIISWTDRLLDTPDGKVSIDTFCNLSERIARLLSSYKTGVSERFFRGVDGGAPLSSRLEQLTIHLLKGLSERLDLVANEQEELDKRIQAMPIPTTWTSDQLSDLKDLSLRQQGLQQRIDHWKMTTTSQKSSSVGESEVEACKRRVMEELAQLRTVQASLSQQIDTKISICTQGLIKTALFEPPGWLGKGRALAVHLSKPIWSLFFSRSPLLPDYTVAIETAIERIEALKEHGVDLNQRDEEGYTPLQLAIVHDRIEVAKALIDCGVDPNLAENGRYTPLEYAAAIGNAGAIKALIDRGADPNQRAENKWTPLELAIENNQIEAVKALIDGGGKS